MALTSVLAGSPDDDGLAAVVRCLEDEDPYVRALSASGLGVLQDKRTVQALVKNFDPQIANMRDTLIILTGESWKTREEWMAWWESHKYHVIYDAEADALVPSDTEFTNSSCRPPANKALQPTLSRTAEVGR